MRGGGYGGAGRSARGPFGDGIADYSSVVRDTDNGRTQEAVGLLTSGSRVIRPQVRILSTIALDSWLDDDWKLR
jgi:hypothetical protein